jgi:hypothetical protein
VNRIPLDYARLDQLAEEFIEYCRRGDRPSVAVFAQTHPEFNEPIRELFPVVLALEQAAKG